MIGYFGHDRFERELLQLEAEEVEDIVGPIVIDQDFIHLQPRGGAECHWRAQRRFCELLDR